MGHPRYAQRLAELSNVFVGVPPDLNELVHFLASLFGLLVEPFPGLFPFCGCEKESCDTACNGAYEQCAEIFHN
jgi:hypothetical protein